MSGSRSKGRRSARFAGVLGPVLSVAACGAQAQQPATIPAAAGSAAVEAIPLNQPSAATLGSRKESYRVAVAGADWVDTHLLVAPGDSVSITAMGEVTLADGRKVTADGSARGWKDLLRQFPDNGSPAGALVARIGNDPAVVPFGVGGTKTLAVATNGELFLRINASPDLTPQGTYNVTMKLSREPQQAAVQQADAALSAKAISPALFDSIPRRVHDKENNPGDMVNFALIGTEAQVAKAFEQAGWVKVDTSDQAAVVHGLVATLEHKAYLEVPVSTLYLFDRPQDLSYARADPITVAAQRHHLRVWRTTEMLEGRPLWVGSSTHDIGFERDQRNNGVTHKIDPDIDKERDFIQQSFAAAGDLQAAAYVTPSDPLRTAKTATGGEFHSDGRIVLLDLKPLPPQ
jgi:LssY C-terminus